MTSFSLQRIVASLEERGLLISRSEDLPDSVKSVSDDSRTVSRGDLFVAVKGTGTDGHRFLPQAKMRGAAVAIIETPGSSDLPFILVKDSRSAAGIAAATFYRFPAREMRVVGVTGTNGKTTTVNILRHLFNGREQKAASIGTLGVMIGDAVESSSIPDDPAAAGNLTTPGAVQLQSTLRWLADHGVGFVAMEVSSHSLDQRRAEGTEFDAAVFTNVSRDHIDYHGTMERYFEAKARLAHLVSSGGFLVTNADDPAWGSLPARADVSHRSFSVRSRADVHASDVRFTPKGSEWNLQIASESFPRVSLPLIGDFNVSNALAAAATAWSLGMSPTVIADLLRSTPQVTGRMERLHDKPVVLRDYAHTPDALERALLALKPFAPEGVTLVFGCGGDRDKGKRPQMGEIAARLADKIIITSDNPRTEDPERILDDIQAGIGSRQFDRIEDRRTAIAYALETASRSGHAVLLAGKGHETYQIRGTERLHFDEKEIVEQLVSGSQRVGSGEGK